MRVLPLLLFAALAAMAHPSWGLVVDGDGRVFFTDVVKNEVYRLDRNGKLHVLKTGVHSHFLRMHGGKLHGEHLWYEPAKDKFFSYAFTLDAEGRFTKVERYDDCARSLCDGLGRRFAAKADRIERIDAEGRVTVLGGVPFAGVAREKYERLMGMALDGAGNLFVADIEQGVVRRVAPEGRVTTARASGINWRPWGVAWGKGALYVLEYRSVPGGTRIVRVGPDGTAMTVFER